MNVVRSDNVEPDWFSSVDVLVIGAGPIGLACAIEVQRVGLSARIVEKDALVNSLLGYPTGMEFFSTPELLEIGGHPLPTARYKPIREEVIDYYIAVTKAEKLDINLYERVLQLEGQTGSFSVITDRGTHPTRSVIITTGFFDQPNLLGVPGEHLPKVTHYYKEPFSYAGQRVAVIGAKNSAARVALDCRRHGAEVTLIHRGSEIGQSVKYWIRPDLENRIAEGSIRAYFNTSILKINQGSLDLQTPDGPITIDNDWVVAMTGYQPDFNFLESLGIKFEGADRTPIHHPETMESNRPGLYLAGTVCGGKNTSRWFIENGRIHAAHIAAHLSGQPIPDIEPAGQP